MSETTRRALRLLDLLQSRSVWSGRELAERLGVTVRSVRRDVARLRELGYPVNASQGVAGGYQLGAGRALPPLLLDDDEAVAVAVSLRLAAGGTVTGAAEGAVRALSKLDQVLPPALREQVHAVMSATSTLDSGQEMVDGDVLIGLARSCRDRMRVRFGHTRRDGSMTRRRVEPVQLVATGRRWYLMAWDLDREDWRTFRLDRITDLEVTTWRFTEREHPDPVQFVGRAVTSPYPAMGRIRLHCSLERARELVPPTVGTLTAVSPRRTLLEVGAGSVWQLAVHIAVLPCDFDVEGPPELAKTFAKMRDRLMRASL